MTRFADLCQELETLANKVDLVHSELSEMVDAEVPYPTAFWRGAYAQCLAVELPDLDEATFSRAWREAQDCLDSCLQAQERDGLGPVDGYLVLVLPGPPAEGIRKQVRRAELDTVACRKHVTWPDQLGRDNSEWAGLLLTTVLGLPDASGTREAATPPELEPPLAELLSLIEVHGARRAARIELGEE